MKDRPILFSAPMVRAILDGSKTQTRRIIKVQPPAGTADVMTYHHPDPRDHYYAWSDELHELLPDWCQSCPYGQSGDRLWVRETFCPIYPQDLTYNGGQPIEYDYAATYQHGFRLGDSLGIKKVWKPSIHMPRAASRITLEITGIRVERLQNISEADSIAEGIGLTASAVGVKTTSDQPQPVAVSMYRDLWESINGAGSWDANPWVWVVEFGKVK